MTSLDVIDLQRLRQLIPAAMICSPYEFVRRIDVAGDTALFVERATRPLAPEDDLRLACRLPSGVEVAVLAERLIWDSTFFGYNVARLDGIFALEASPHQFRDYGPAVSALLETAGAKDITYLFASVDARDISALQALGDAGFALIESRLFYHRTLEDWTSDERYDVRVATPSDVEVLSTTARDTVNPYDRFHADPFVCGADADRLMCKWVDASIRDGFADVVFVPNCSAPKAFVTVRHHQDKWHRWGLRLGQPVLSAVSPEFKGWYRKLISESHYYLREVGAQHVYMTTQPTNAAVLWIWEQLGYHYAKTEHVLRKVLRPALRSPRTT
jgi:dTDP-4-amino-4,6-dideoxy-D-galactose acyltransferase